VLAAAEPLPPARMENNDPSPKSEGTMVETASICKARSFASAWVMLDETPVELSQAAIPRTKQAPKSRNGFLIMNTP
jgi:hypothetical protein